LLLPPIAFRWASIGVIAAVFAVAVVGWYAVRSTRAARDRDAADIAHQDFPDPPPEVQPRLEMVRRYISRARILERLGPLFTAFLLLSTIGIAASALDVTNLGPSQLSIKLTGKDSALTAIVTYISDVGTYLLVTFVVSLVLLGLIALQSRDFRRIVAIVWDLGTFWPRTAHPFAPPCYAERAVPELARRVQALTEYGTVVLSGHSQGSVLAAATLLQLPPETTRRVALLSYGSPLRRVYARLFPAYFGVPVLHELGDRLGWRWRNLWRDTDPVGGSIFSAHRSGEPPAESGPAGDVDIRLRDPRGLTVPPLDTVPPAIERHWPYYNNEEYFTTLAILLRTLEGTADRPPP
jgi:hypothetical protein